MPLWIIHVLKLLGSGLLALPIGWDREEEDRSAGVRTFPLVAMASCGVMLVILSTGTSADASRVLQGLITGIGFVGGGAILRLKESVHGTATAAGILGICVIGTAVAYGLYDIAVSLTVIEFLAFRVLQRLRQRMEDRSS